MKYCPKDKSHKNPAEAVFCCECGSRLVEVADNKICPKCGMSNPNEAIFCRECGTKLPDANGNVELTVYSSEICDRILAVGTNSYQTNTSKSVLKVPARKSVDILLQCGGKPFRITTDLTKSNTLNVNWGTIEIQCKDCCQVRMTGRNMDVPLIKQNASKEVIKVPYGVYTLKFELDGETEEMTVDVHGKIKVESHLQRKYELIIKSDVKIDRLTIDNGNAVDVQSNKFLWRNTQGTYTFRIYATSINGSGSYETTINLNKDTMIELQWCHINVKTNGQATAIFRQDAASSQTRITHNGSFSLLAVRGIKHELQLTKPHGETHKEIITPKKEQLEIMRNWGDLVLTFDKNRYEGIQCFCEIHNCRTSIPESKEILLKDVSFGKQYVKYYINDRRFVEGNSTVEISNSNLKINCFVPTEKVTKQKYRWLRNLIYYAIFVIDMVCLMAVPGREIISCFIKFENNNNIFTWNFWGNIYLIIITFFGYLYFTTKGLGTKKILMPLCMLSFMFLSGLVLGVLSDICIKVYSGANWNDVLFSEYKELEHNIICWNYFTIEQKYHKNLIFLSFYYTVIWFATYLGLNIKIKNYSIKETLL